MQTILNTLYVTSPEAYLRLDNKTLRVEVERQTRLRVPLHHVSSVVCFGEVLITAPAMWALAEAGKTLVLLDRNGRFKARMEGPVSGNILLRQAQFLAQADTERTLSLAQDFVAGKLHNSRNVLLRGAREAKLETDAAQLTQAATALGHSLTRLPRTTDLDAVRGTEGEAARQYFQVLTCLVKPDAREAFAMRQRTRRPPLDRMNALLSFLYSLLMNDCRSALESVGLDPQLGFLHAVRPGRAALALDLMEEFRAPLADRLALTLINRAQLQAKDFILEPGGAVRLTNDARKTVLTAYQLRKQEELTHPLAQRSLALGLIPQLQARLLARVLRNEAEGYLPFIPK